MRKQGRVVSLISGLFIVLILIQHKYIFMYFDDYGYASLSYGWTENKAGMSYGLIDIITFLRWHYMNWGGRVLYFLLEILAFWLGGIELIQIIQAVIIIAICILSGKIVSVITNVDQFACIAAALMFYGIFDIQTLRDGVYWYSASVAYVWPLLPLLTSIYLLYYIINSMNKRSLKKILCIISTFLAAFSQEQTAIMVIVTNVMIIVLIFLDSKFQRDFSRLKYMFINSLTALIGGGLAIFAPGNFVRADDKERYASFYNKSLVEKLVDNLGVLVNINIGKYNWKFILILTLCCGFAVAFCFRNKKLLIAPILFSCYLVIEQMIIVPSILEIGFRIIYICWFVPIIIGYLYKQKKILLLSLFIGGICSQGMMLVSPSISIRCHTMFEFVLHLIILDCIFVLIKNKEKYLLLVVQTGMLFLLMYSLYNFSSIIIGYRNNYEINLLNHYKLYEASMESKAGTEVEDIKLYRLMDDTYANAMPYQEGVNFIEVWMKKYYELPESINLIWGNIGQTSSCQLMEGDYWEDKWLGKTATFMLETERPCTYTMYVNNLLDIEGQKIIVTIDGESAEYGILSSKECKFELNVNEGEHECIISTEKVVYPDNEDKRALGVWLDIVY